MNLCGTIVASEFRIGEVTRWEKMSSEETPNVETWIVYEEILHEKAAWTVKCFRCFGIGSVQPFNWKMGMTVVLK